MSAITRTQFRNALYTLLVSEKTAHPDRLRTILRYRPGNLPAEKPAAWIGNILETAAFDSGTRSRVMTTDVTIAANLPTDLVTDADPFDQLLDDITELFTGNATVIPDTITELSAVDDGEVSFVGVERTLTTRGAVLTVQLRIWEGRV